MATTKPDLSSASTSGIASGAPAGTTPDAPDTSPPAVPDFSTSATWGLGGRYIINSAGDRVPAPSGQTDQE